MKIYSKANSHWLCWCIQSLDENGASQEGTNKKKILKRCDNRRRVIPFRAPCLSNGWPYEFSFIFYTTPIFRLCSGSSVRLSLFSFSTFYVRTVIRNLHQVASKIRLGANSRNLTHKLFRFYKWLRKWGDWKMQQKKTLENVNKNAVANYHRMNSPE